MNLYLTYGKYFFLIFNIYFFSFEIGSVILQIVTDKTSTFLTLLKCTSSDNTVDLILILIWLEMIFLYHFFINIFFLIGISYQNLKVQYFSHQIFHEKFLILICNMLCASCFLVSWAIKHEPIFLIDWFNL